MIIHGTNRHNPLGFRYIPLLAPLSMTASISSRHTGSNSHSSTPAGFSSRGCKVRLSKARGLDQWGKGGGFPHTRVFIGQLSVRHQGSNDLLLSSSGCLTTEVRQTWADPESLRYLDCPAIILHRWSLCRHCHGVGLLIKQRTPQNLGGIGVPSRQMGAEVPHSMHVWIAAPPDLEQNSLSQECHPLSLAPSPSPYPRPILISYPLLQ